MSGRLGSWGTVRNYPNDLHFWERPESWDESWRLDENCCPSNFSEKTSANTDVKNSKGVNNYNNTAKLAQKEYKTRHDWVDKGIYWELIKKFKFDHMNKWYMHNPESVQENETHKLLWDFEIQTDHQIWARLPNLIISKKKKRKEKRELAELWTLLSLQTAEGN